MRIPAKALVLALSLVMAATAVVVAELPDLIPREVLFGNPAKISPKISPDGKFLAYIAPDQGVLNVWVRTIGKTDDHAVTKDRRRSRGWRRHGEPGPGGLGARDTLEQRCNDQRAQSRVAAEAGAPVRRLRSDHR